MDKIEEGDERRGGDIGGIGNLGVSRFRAEDEFILLSSPRVTGPTNYDEDF